MLCRSSSSKLPGSGQTRRQRAVGARPRPAACSARLTDLDGGLQVRVGPVLLARGPRTPAAGRGPAPTPAGCPADGQRRVRGRLRPVGDRVVHEGRGLGRVRPSAAGAARPASGRTPGAARCRPGGSRAPRGARPARPRPTRRRWCGWSPAARSAPAAAGARRDRGRLLRPLDRGLPRSPRWTSSVEQATARSSRAFRSCLGPRAGTVSIAQTSRWSVRCGRATASPRRRPRRGRDRQVVAEPVVDAARR